MAQKTTYLYEIIMGHGERDEETVYVYARNAGCAVDALKEIHKDKKYDSFKAKMFGEADFNLHQEPFKLMSQDEVNIIMKYGLAKNAAYRQRKKASIPAGGEFIPASEGERL